jgi:hypothetical protein
VLSLSNGFGPPKVPGRYPFGATNHAISEAEKVNMSLKIRTEIRTQYDASHHPAVLEPIPFWMLSPRSNQHSGMRCGHQLLLGHRHCSGQKSFHLACSSFTKPPNRMSPISMAIHGTWSEAVLARFILSISLSVSPASENPRGVSRYCTEFFD